MVRGNWTPPPADPESLEKYIYGMLPPDRAEKILPHFRRAFARRAADPDGYRAAVAARQESEIDAARADFGRRRALAESGIDPAWQYASLDAGRYGQPLDRHEGNRLALRCCGVLATAWKAGHKGLVLWGSPGGGKTHMAVAVLIALAGRGVPVRFANVPDLMDRLRQSQGKSYDDPYTASAEQIYQETAVRPAVLLLDDLGADRPTEFVCDQLYRLLSHRDARGLTTMVTTNFPRARIEQVYDARLASRVYGNVKEVEVSGADYREVVSEFDPFEELP